MAQLQSTQILSSLSLIGINRNPFFQLSSGSNIAKVQLLNNKSLLISASIQTPYVIKSTVKTVSGYSPFDIQSTVLVNNLNSHLWYGHYFDDYLNQAVKTNSQVTFNKLSLSGSNNIMKFIGNGTYFIQLTTNGLVIGKE